MLFLLFACSPPSQQVESLDLPVLEHLEPEVQNRLRSAIEKFRANENTGDSKKQAENYGRLGMVLSAHHLQEPAASCYHNAAYLDETSSKWPYLLGFTRQEMGLTTEAVQAYDLALKREPDFPNAKLRKALTLVQTDPGKAKRILETLASNENSDVVSATLGRIALSEQDYATAANKLENALTLNPSASQLRAPLALAYRGLGRIDDANNQMTLLGEADVAVRDRILGEVTELSASAQMFLARGLALAREKRYESAARSFARAIELNPTSANAHASHALALDRLGNTTEALKQVRKAIALDGELAAAHYHLASLLEAAQNDEDAESSYERVVVLDPNYAEAQLALGNIRMRLGDYPNAEPAYERAVSLIPDNAIVSYRYALSLLANGDCAQAQNQLKSAVSIDSRLAPIIQAWARVSSTCAQSNDGDRQRALADAEVLYEVRPNIQHAELYAMALAANQRFEDAIGIQKELVDQAKRQGALANRPDLEQNLERYRQGRRADAAWHEGAQVFKPESIK